MLREVVRAHRRAHARQRALGKLFYAQIVARQAQSRRLDSQGGAAEYGAPQSMQTVAGATARLALFTLRTIGSAAIEEAAKDDVFAAMGHSRIRQEAKRSGKRLLLQHTAALN